MDARNIIEQGLAHLTDHAVEPVSHGAVKETYIVEPETGPGHVVQIGRSGQARIERAAAIYERLDDATDLPVPAVRDTDRPADPVAYLVTERLPGENPESEFGQFDPDRIDSLLKEAATTLATAHVTVDVEGYGTITVDDGDLIGAGDSWSAFLDRKAEWYLDQAAGSIFDVDGLIEEARQAYERHRKVVPDDPVPSLLHNDFRPGNLLIEGEAIVGVLDWDNGYIGDSGYDYVDAEESFCRRWDAEQQQRRRDLFRSAYEEVHDAPDGELLLEYRLIDRLSSAQDMLWLAEHHDLELDEGDRRYHVGGLEAAVRSLERYG